MLVFKMEVSVKGDAEKAYREFIMSFAPEGAKPEFFKNRAVVEMEDGTREDMAAFFDGILDVRPKSPIEVEVIVTSMEELEDGEAA